ncbi:hypothetical protein LOTGIDRAFT_173265 [Lottia gigantea]|uniref:Uncharacterized protein n=1 Tax=Lottia gigantea TaxID=225164 RepID=V4B265_LOTGI|nr:hypothetical protein LOTGIDRAFT_173265 [Lottia gigantea]ESP00362.1 hypothetical protein LOTGIDRAFT_173265 [Lottia gigantea]
MDSVANPNGGPKNVKNSRTSNIINQYRKTLFQADLGEYKAARNRFKRLCDSQKFKYRIELEKSRKLNLNNPKIFWQNIKSLLKRKPNVSRIPANDWLSYFSRLYSYDTDNSIQSVSERVSVNDQVCQDCETGLPTEPNLFIAEDEIRKTVSSMKNRKAAGNDGFCIELIKESQFVMIPILSKLFNVIFETGLMTSSFPGTIYGALYYRDLENEKTVALKHNKGNFEASIILGSLAKKE